MRKRREIKKLNKICTDCNEKAVDGKTTCRKCASKASIRNKLRKRELRAKGICPQCGENKPAVEGKAYCQKCLDAKNNRDRLLKEQGLCACCGTPAVEGKTYCLNYIIKKQAKFAGTTVNILMRLFDKQDGVCPYSGRKLILGKTASVDHVIAKNNGGTNDESNLQWVHIHVNRAKSGIFTIMPRCCK